MNTSFLYARKQCHIRIIRFKRFPFFIWIVSSLKPIYKEFVTLLIRLIIKKHKIYYTLKPWTSAASIRAPFWSKRSVTSMEPLTAAQCKGVCFILSTELTSPPHCKIRQNQIHQLNWVITIGPKTNSIPRWCIEQRGLNCWEQPIEERRSH